MYLPFQQRLMTKYYFPHCRTHEDSVYSVVRQGNEREDQWEGVHDNGKTGTDVRGRDIEEST